MGGIAGLLVPFLLGVDSCAPGGTSSPVGGGGGGTFEAPEDPPDTADTGENGGTPGPLTNCDPEYDAVWVECHGKQNWVFHAEMNVAVQWIDVKFHGSGEGTQITEDIEAPGTFEGDVLSPGHACAEPATLDFQAFGTMFSTHECSYDYAP